jgi:5-methylcytosine-specific restriction endonuclease McrA
MDEWWSRNRAFDFRQKAEQKSTKTDRDKFRSSLAWKRTRYKVLALNAATQKDGKPRCEICGRGVADGVRLEVDHIVPLANHGGWEKRLELSNLRVLCSDDNGGRLNKPINGL